MTFNFQILETGFFWKKFSDFPGTDLIVSKDLFVSKILTIVFYGISAISRYPVLSQAPNISDATTFFLFFPVKQQYWNDLRESTDMLTNIIYDNGTFVNVVEPRCAIFREKPKFSR